MNSDFLSKFKGKTNKIPKEGVLNLIQATHSKTPKLLPPKPKLSNHPSESKTQKPKNPHSKIHPSAKQNKRHLHASNSALQLKRSPDKKSNKNREIFSVKDNKKPLENSVNLKRQPLKLPKIKKPDLSHNAQSVRQIHKQPIKAELRQVRDRITLPQKSDEKLKRSLLTEGRQLKPQRSQMGIFGLESMLDDEALRQLKKLNDLEAIVQEISFKRRKQIVHEEIHEQKYNRKGYTVHL